MRYEGTLCEQSNALHNQAAKVLHDHPRRRSVAQSPGPVFPSPASGVEDTQASATFELRPYYELPPLLCRAVLTDQQTARHGNAK